MCMRAHFLTPCTRARMHADNLNLMKDYADNPNFAPKDGDIWAQLDPEILTQIPATSVATEVLPVYIQLHMDGVQVRKEFSFNPVTALHINATPYNSGEDLRCVDLCMHTCMHVYMNALARARKL